MIKQKIVEFFREQILSISGQDAQRRINGLARDFVGEAAVNTRDIEILQERVERLHTRYTQEKFNREQLVARVQAAEAGIAGNPRKHDCLGTFLQLEESISAISSELKCLEAGEINQKEINRIVGQNLTELEETCKKLRAAELMNVGLR